jgi:hypothetical protein
MRHFLLLLFSVAGGLTLSGIVANLYRLLGKKPQGRAATCAFYGVMLLAGPSVLLGNATRSFRKKECSRVAYGFALGLATYWSFMLGAVLVGLAI